MNKKIKIFIAYSQKDRLLLDEFRVHATPLVRNQQLEVWFDGEIRPGEVWSSVIKKSLHSADIILLLISANSLASDYFYSQEVQDALERHHSDAARVIPVLLSECLWEETPIATLQGLPKGMKPISDWPNRDAAWNNVMLGLRGIIQEILHKNIKDSENLFKSESANSTIQNSETINNPSAADSNAWEFTVEINKRSAYEKYLTRFPQGFYAHEAKTNLENFIADDIAWEFALEAQTEKAIQKYLDKYPEGAHYSEAVKELGKFNQAVNTNNKRTKAKERHRCSFCGRGEEEVMILVSGMDGQICEVCTEKAQEIIDDELKKAGVKVNKR